MTNICNVLQKEKILPVITVKDPRNAHMMIEIIKQGGLSTAEITLRTVGAIDAIKVAAQKFRDMWIGAGTVLNEKQAEAAISAGAKFIVSPGFSEKIAEKCKKKEILYIPGCVTASEIMKVLDHSLSVVKFFPAEKIGGPDILRSYLSVFPQVSFIPTGGIDSHNIKSYLNLENVLACGGTWIIQEKDLNHYEKTEYINKIRVESASIITEDG